MWLKIQIEDQKQKRMRTCEQKRELKLHYEEWEQKSDPSSWTVNNLQGEIWRNS